MPLECQVQTISEISEKKRKGNKKEGRKKKVPLALKVRIFEMKVGQGVNMGAAQ